MKIAILHLSDIHLRGADGVTQRVAAIASCAFAASRECDACLVLVTGDISFSASSGEYACAASFLQDIAQAIKNEGCPVVDVVLVPGNHDCKLIPEDKARSVVIQQVTQVEGLANDVSIVAHCTGAQAEFFNFRRQITQSKPVFDSPLWTEYEWVIDGDVLRISALNAAWMSRLPELPGQLVFPVDPYMGQLTAPCVARLAMIHHPLNWYCQSTYHPLRRALHTHADAILSGHEHLANSGQVSESLSGESLFYEAAALQPHNAENIAGFSVLKLDTALNEVVERRYVVHASAIVPSEEEYIRVLRANPFESAGQYELTSEFHELLREPGGDFIHPVKGNVELDDVFVYPDVALSGVADERAYPADVVLAKVADGTSLLFLADERAGKTTLLHRAFRDFHGRGLVPLLLRANTITSTSAKDLAKVIQRETQQQYSQPHNADTASKCKRVALIDNIDRLPGGAKGLERVLSYLEQHFFAIVATASEGFEIAELVGKAATTAVSKFSTYAILTFGHRLRHQLIRKWCLCGNVTTNHELDQRVYAVESILESVVGRNLVPSQPIYLLILLQSCDHHQQAELQNSGFAHYYQYLITRSLGKAGVKAEELNELFNYLANLAWLYRSTNVKELGIVELRGFNKSFCEKFTTVELGARLQLLQSAKILRQHGEHYAFAYPYVYFFFLGKYLADNLNNNEVRGLVEEWCKNLHRRDNAHAVLFLTHHRNDSWVIEQVASVLKASFPEPTHMPMRFDTDIAGINALVEEASELLLAAPNIDKNQENYRRMQDDIEAEDAKNGDDGDIKSDIAFVTELVRLMKTCEILGQILKNYYGSLERARKETYIRQVIDGPLRLIRIVIDTVANDSDGFVREINAAMERSRLANGSEDAVATLADPMAQRNREKDADERKKERAKRIGFMVLGQLSTGVVARAAQFVGTEKLTEDIHAVVQENPSNAYRLVQAATSLIRAGPLPVELLRKLSEDLANNPFAFKMLQSLGAWHIRQFHMEEKDKQRLCAHLNIEITAAQLLEFNTRSRKLTKRAP